MRMVLEELTTTHNVKVTFHRERMHRCEILRAFRHTQQYSMKGVLLRWHNIMRIHLPSYIPKNHNQRTSSKNPVNLRLSPFLTNILLPMNTPLRSRITPSVVPQGHNF